MKGFFKCQNETRYIHPNKICNGNYDCFKGDDEFLCIWPEIEKQKNIEICKQTHLFTIECNFTDSIKQKNLVSIKNIEYSKQIVFTGKFVFNFLKSSYNLNILKIHKYSNYFNSTNHSFPNLILLELKENLLNENSIFLNQKLMKLRKLIIIKNSFKNLNFLNNLYSIELNELYINYSIIQYLNQNTFKYNSNLKLLEIKNSRLLNINEKFLQNILLLKFLNMKSTYSPFFIKFMKNLKILKKLEKVKSNYYDVCCFCWKYVNKGINCEPSVHKLYNCSNLLSNYFQKIYFWFISLFGLFINFYGIFYFIKSKSSSKYYKIILFLSQCLFFSYYLSISIVSIHLSNLYYEIWRNSFFCKFLSIIFQFSIQFSSLIILFITIERYLTICYFVKQTIFKKNPLKLLIFSGLFIILISILHVIIFSVSFFFHFFFLNNHLKMRVFFKGE